MCNKCIEEEYYSGETFEMEICTKPNEAPTMTEFLIPDLDGYTNSKRIRTIVLGVGIPVLVIAIALYIFIKRRRNRAKRSIKDQSASIPLELRTDDGKIEIVS
ncbi:hypothetical protein BGZ76_003641, partial [Entomortierella beljakovae]